jgi:hypothetical protein
MPMGSGIKTFTNGSILTDTDINGYLMQQSVVTCTSGTRPASPTTGQPIYETDTKLVRVWDGSSWYSSASPDYVDYSASVVFYSNAVSGTTIAGGSVTVTYARYQMVNTRCHYIGHATINTTTASGFGVSLPFNAPYRSFSLSHITLGGVSGYTTSFGRGHCPNSSAPFNRVSPVTNSNSNLNIASSGDTVHWNIEYETT